MPKKPPWLGPVIQAREKIIFKKGVDPDVRLGCMINVC